MKIKVPFPSDTKHFMVFDTDKFYLYYNEITISKMMVRKNIDPKTKEVLSYSHYDKRRKFTEGFIVKPVLKMYEAEGAYYETYNHYGWVFEIVEVLKHHYKYEAGWDIGTVPDLMCQVTEY